MLAGYIIVSCCACLWYMISRLDRFLNLDEKTFLVANNLIYLIIDIGLHVYFT